MKKVYVFLLLILLPSLAWTQSFYDWFENADGDRNGVDIISISPMFAGDEFSVVFGVINGFYWSLRPRTTIGFDIRYGISTGEGGAHFSISPVYGVVLSIHENDFFKLQVFTDILLEIGYFGGTWKGILTEIISPGFDIGVDFRFDFGYFDIKYRGVIFNNCYVHSIGVCWGIGLNVTELWELLNDL